MPMFRSKKVKTEYVTPQFYKDWAQADAEIESLGKRLDAVRGIVAELVQRGEGESWALRHWQEVEAVVLRKWQHTVRLKQVGLRQVGTTPGGPEIDYSWWEGHDGINGPMFPGLNPFANWFNHSDLSHSWEKAREQKLQKARLGLA